MIRRSFILLLLIATHCNYLTTEVIVGSVFISTAGFSWISVSRKIRENWIRKLPDVNRNFQKDFRPVGIWAKKTNPKSGMNVPWHKHVWSEEIHFLPESNHFEKYYQSFKYIGEKLSSSYIIGKGEYFVNGNWILLKTNQISIRGEEKQKKNFKKFYHKLLYYYSEETNSLTPMIYEEGYIEKNFGVLEGIRKPYQDDEYLKIAIKNFSKKEFISHSYYLAK